MVDAVDRTRFPEAKKALDYLLTCDELSSVPFLVLGNKIDSRSPPAASEEDLRYSLGLYETFGKDGGKSDGSIDKMRPIELFMCSVIKKVGYADNNDAAATPQKPATSRKNQSLFLSLANHS